MLYDTSSGNIAMDESLLPEEIILLICSLADYKTMFALGGLCKTISAKWKNMVTELPECAMNSDGVNLVSFPYLTTLIANKVDNQGICLLTKLRKLDLRCNYQITDRGISGLTNLTELNLCCSITNVGLKNLTLLQVLDLGFNCNIDDEGLSLLRQVTRLHPGINPLITEECVFSLPSLRALSYYHPFIKITSLPDHITVCDRCNIDFKFDPQAEF